MAAVGRVKAGKELTLRTRMGVAAAALSGKAATEPRLNQLHLKNVLFALAFILFCFTVSILSKQKSKTVSTWFVSKKLAADALLWVVLLMVRVTLGGLTMSLIAETLLFVKLILVKMLQKKSNAIWLCVPRIISKIPLWSLSLSKNFMQKNCPRDVPRKI
jgi:uncharacterized membrane protein YcjF (UPF0283 family)